MRAETAALGVRSWGMEKERKWGHQVGDPGMGKWEFRKAEMAEPEPVFGVTGLC